MKWINEKKRKELIEKLGEECNACSETKSLHIHHKDRDRENNNLNNLSLFCNSCHNKLHFEKGELTLCSKCGRIMREDTEHICPTKEELRGYAIKNIVNRERCKKCGKLMGKNHSCKHPKGMKGKKHSAETKARISNTLKKKLKAKGVI